MSNYTELQPGTEEYKAFIKESILSGDTDTLKRIKDRIGAPIHIITDYSAYFKEDKNQSAIHVCRPEDRVYYELEDSRLFDWQGNECGKRANIAEGSIVITCKDEAQLERFINGKDLLIMGDGVVFILPDNGRN